MELFSDYNTSQFIENQKMDVKNEINRLTNDEICNTPIDELLDYFGHKYKIDLIEVEHEFDYINYDVKETNKKVYNEFHRHLPFEKEYYYIDAYKIIYEIPFEGCEELLYLKPSSYIWNKFEVDNIFRPTEQNEGKIVFSKVYGRKEINEKENLKEFTKNEFNKDFSNYIKMIEYVNSDISVYNEELGDNIKTLLENRLEKAKDYINVREKLDIPLKLNSNAPNIKPIRLKKVKKDKNREFPKLKSSPIEYSISDDDYENIKNIINLTCISMEKLARTFCKFQEEELRDVILSNLNTHYQNNATGETFNKRGKTDIHIPFENKSAYIGECKIWTGKEKFLAAIDQLFSYMRWRDTKTSLIIFNKKNKDFPKLIETIDDLLSKHELKVKKIKLDKNSWQCKLKKSKDSTEIVDINIVVYDLYIEK